jgi:hypothetical protein
MATKTLTMTPADLFKYQNELVRTGKFLPLGRMRTIAVGPCDTYTPPPNDPIISGYGPQPQRNARGRMLDFSGQWLPIGQAQDKSMILVTSTMIRKDGYVGLPDLVDPLWRAADFSPEEAANPDCDADCRKQWDVVKGKRVAHVHIQLRGDKDKARLIPQRLEDRTNDRLQGTNFLVFQPVLRITYQPEDLKPGGQQGFKPTEWKIEFRPELGGTHAAFLVDPTNGECHFFGGVPIFGGDTKG